MMRSFIAFVRKEFYHIFRDGRTLMIIFLMPLVLVILFGFAITNEIRNADIAIVDQAKDEHSRAVSAKLLSSGYFRLAGEYQTRDEVEAAFEAGKIKLAVVFHPDFGFELERNGKAMISMLADGTEPNQANTLRTYAEAIIRDYLAGISPAKAPIRTEVRMLFNPRLDGAFYFVPGVITLILMLISAMMTSVTIAREKETGTMEILLVSPLKPPVIILGKTIPYILLALINAITVLAVGAFVFHIPVSGNLILLLAECLLFILNALAIGLLISTIAESQQVALMISLMGLLMPSILLSGFIFPPESMPAFLQVISNAVPAKWFIIIIKNVMLKGSGFYAVMHETLILAGITVVLMGLSVRNFKNRLE